MKINHISSSDVTTRKVENDYELSDSFDSDWRLGWE